MRLNVKALSIASAISWGACLFLVGVAHVVWPGYGGAFLDLMSSIYPGFKVGGLVDVLIGTCYALLDGAVCGLVIAWLYNAVAGPTATEA